MKNLLIVEDELEIIDLIKTVVDLSKYNTVIATDFKEAAAILSTSKIDLVITDFNFPGGNGNLVAIFALSLGVRNIWLHTGDVENPKINQRLFNMVFPKLSKLMIERLVS